MRGTTIICVGSSLVRTTGRPTTDGFALRLLLGRARKAPLMCMLIIIIIILPGRTNSARAGQVEGRFLSSELSRPASARGDRGRIGRYRALCSIGLPAGSALEQRAPLQPAEVSEPKRSQDGPAGATGERFLAHLGAKRAIQARARVRVRAGSSGRHSIWAILASGRSEFEFEFEFGPATSGARSTRFHFLLGPLFGPCLRPSPCSGRRSGQSARRLRRGGCGPADKDGARYAMPVMCSSLLGRPVGQTSGALPARKLQEILLPAPRNKRTPRRRVNGRPPPYRPAFTRALAGRQVHFRRRAFRLIGAADEP